jgi:tyrosine-protein phosphatase YwqE
MISFFRSKPLLKDLIPNNFIDIHSHILPGIDDGAQTIDDTNSLIISLKELGFEQLITTPHIMANVWDNTKTSIETTLQKTINDLDGGNKIPIKAAAEYLMDGNFAELLQKEPLLALKENYVLVEMSYLNPPIQLYDIIFELQVAGYKPVLAHPERYTFYHNNLSEYEKLKQAGCLFQLNLLSTMGYYGSQIAAIGDSLLKKGMIDFVGSDVHHREHIRAFSRKILIKETAGLKEAIDNNQFFRF